MTTARFGKAKFGEFKFGPTVLEYSRLGLEVDWDSNGLFSGANEAVYMQDMTIVRGRQYTFSQDGESFEEEGTGKFSAVILDENRRYDPYYTGSGLYGQLAGGKLFRVRVRTTGDAYYPLMAGVLEEPVSYDERGVQKARLAGSDGWAFLRGQNNQVTVALQENVYADEAMADVLAQVGWPGMWGYDLDAGVDLRSYFFVESRSAAKVIHELAHSELGQVCLQADGALRFRARTSLESDALTLTDADVMLNGVRRLSPSEVIRNIIRVESTPRSEGSSQVVWTLPGALEIGAGETVDDVWASFTYNGQETPCKDVLQPVVTTDYKAAANEDGSGTDLTANISVTVYPFSTRGNVSITNSGGVKAYLYFGRIWATPLIAGNVITFEARDEDSIRQFGARPFTMRIEQNVNIARQYKEILELFLPDAKNYLTVDLVPNDAVQFGIDLGQIIRAKLDGLGIDRSFRVIRIEHKFADRSGMAIRTRWWLEPYVRLFAGVQIPVQLPFQLAAV